MVYFNEIQGRVEMLRVNEILFVLGRKNWLFSGSPKGAEASALLYSLIETAKANNCEPYSYLRHIFEHLPQANALVDYKALLPWNVDKMNIMLRSVQAVD
jgi:transposase